MNRKLNMDCLDAQSFLNGLVFFAPVALLVRTAAGVSLARFFRLEALLSLVVLVSEIPTGRLTDRVGLRNTLVLCQVTLCLARVLLLLAYVRRSYPLFVAEAVAEGVAGSLSSGTQSAYLYRMFPGPAYLTKSARTANWGTVGFLLSTAAYAGLYRLAGLTGLLAATVLTSACGIAASLGIRQEPPQRLAEEDGKPAHRALGVALRRREAVLVMVLLAALGVGRILINFFYADKLMACGVDETWLSPIILGYSLLELLAEGLLGRLEPNRHRAALTVFLALGGGVMVAFALVNRVAPVVLLMLALPLVLDVPSYLLGEVQNRLVDDLGQTERRAEMLSLWNMGVNVAEVAFLFGSSLLSGAGAALCFCGLGIALAALGGCAHRALKETIA
ncbi:MAG: MFS transporter [Clostridiales bacterium]|nr:MFS transporter [Clostridiales bacterium]